jgi:hypothetical protein
MPCTADIPVIMLIEANLIRRSDMGSKGRKNDKKPKKAPPARPAAGSKKEDNSGTKKKF